MIFLSVFMLMCWFYIDSSGAQVCQGMVEPRGFRSIVVKISAFTLGMLIIFFFNGSN